MLKTLSLCVLFMLLLSCGGSETEYDLCVESQNMSDPFPTISGAIWEYTHHWNCPYNDLLYVLKDWSISGRQECADLCLANNACTSFLMGKGECFLKRSFQMSVVLGKTCGYASSTREMFTLLERSCIKTPTAGPTTFPEIPTETPTMTEYDPCAESQDLSDPFPTISGAIWEYTQNWNCPYNDLLWVLKDWSISGRQECADLCLANVLCTSFLISKGKSCFLKRGFQMSVVLGKTCGYAASSRHMFTLLERSCTKTPTGAPTTFPSATPTTSPSPKPSRAPTQHPTSTPTEVPTETPTMQPTTKPSEVPTPRPTSFPSAVPTVRPSTNPSGVPSALPTVQPSANPNVNSTPIDSVKATDLIGPIDIYDLFIGLGVLLVFVIIVVVFRRFRRMKKKKHIVSDLTKGSKVDVDIEYSDSSNGFEGILSPEFISHSLTTKAEI